MADDNSYSQDQPHPSGGADESISKSETIVITRLNLDENSFKVELVKAKRAATLLEKQIKTGGVADYEELINLLGGEELKSYLENPRTEPHLTLVLTLVKDRIAELEPIGDVLEFGGHIEVHAATWQMITDCSPIGLRLRTPDEAERAKGAAAVNSATHRIAAQTAAKYLGLDQRSTGNHNGRG